VGFKLSKVGIRRLQSKYSITWCPSLGLYLLLVWGFAIARKNYLWIEGDDPNLITQAALTHNGLKPNLDFESGYPGLSQFIQADLMHFFGVNIFSQHLYAALLASITGLLICINFPKLPQWLLSLGLILIYCQQHLVNPTPNPGHLFELLLLSIFTLINRGVRLSNRLVFFASFILLGIAFLAKQYAVFVLFGYAMSQFEQANWKNLQNKKNSILLFFGILVASLYYFLLIPSGSVKAWAAISLIAMVLPYVVLIWAVNGIKSERPNQSFHTTIKNVAGGSLIFLLTVSLGFVILYQSFNLKDISYQVLIEVPRKINDNIVLLSVGAGTLISLAAFLVVAFTAIYLLDSQYSSRIWRFKDYLFQVLIMFTGILAFTKIGNLSTSIFMVLIPMIIVYFYFKKISVIDTDRKQFFFILTCYQFVLIPYPNVNFHIMIFVVGYFILLKDKLGIMKPAKMMHLWTFPIILVALLLVHEVRTIDSMRTYSFQEVQFKSGAIAWSSVINEAQAADGVLSACSTIGCKMLLLVSEK